MKLRKVYSSASRVLVVDHHLQQVGTHWLEMRLQLLCCEWLRRLWTLQEGRLASKVYIQFRYQAVSVAEFLQRDLKLDPRFDSDIFGRLCLKTSLRIKTHFEQQQDVNERFLDLVTDLSHRSVTVASDEPICIATLLGLTLEKLPQPPTMADIYRSLPTLPQDLIFIPRDRLNIPGLRWAASTFLGQGNQEFPRPYSAAIWSGGGFQIQKDCILLEKGFDFNRDPGSLAELYFINCTGGSKFVVWCDEPPKQRSRMFSKAAIIFQKDSEVGKDTSRAILVSDPVRSEGLYRCSFEMNLLTWRKNDHTRHTIEKMAKQPLRKVFYDVAGTYCPQEHFCIH
jgi:hypothetical protein